MTAFALLSMVKFFVLLTVIKPFYVRFVRKGAGIMYVHKPVQVLTASECALSVYLLSMV